MKNLALNMVWETGAKSMMNDSLKTSRNRYAVTPLVISTINTPICRFGKYDQAK